MRVLIVDDEQVIRNVCEDFLKRLGYETVSVDNTDAAMRVLETSAVDAMLLDVCLPGTDGLTFLRNMRQNAHYPQVIMITGHGTIDMAIQALRLGANDFLRKPLNLLELEAAVLRCEQASRASRRSTRLLSVRPQPVAARFIGRSAFTKDVVHQLDLAAQSGCQNLLLYGETGTGKEVAARMFHDLRYGKECPFVAVNCPALPDNLFESELLGHVKGAFTGAIADRAGAFELASGGVLFLDEVADLSPAHQSKLLRVLETRRVQRVGDLREREVNVSVVAASNRSLEACVEDGTFRADLYFRLNVFAVTLVPLRQRIEDIEPLARHFLQQYAVRVDLQDCDISDEAIQVLQKQPFPGNARELRNQIERAAILARGKTIQAAHLGCDSSLSRLSVSESFGRQESALSAVGRPVRVASKLLPDGEAETTLQALQQCGWNRRKAAKLLSISYESIRWRIKKHGLSEQ